MATQIKDASPEPEAAQKLRAMHIENQQNLSGLSPEDAEFLQNYPEEKKKRVIRKVDIRLIPMLLFLYLITYLDKTNIGNAKIEGLLESLNMTGEQYNIALSIFFIPYILAEVPSNMILNKFTRPSIYMGMIVLSWGIIMTLTGIVKNFGGLCAVRVMLGLFEAGFFPGAILLVSKWYLPDETQTRIALLYSSAASGGAFSGLLAFAIAKMDGIGGMEGWRWIFILEGLLTVVMGVRYLEVRQVARRISNTKEYREKHFDVSAFWSVVADWKMYLLILGSWSNACDEVHNAHHRQKHGLHLSQGSAPDHPPYICGAVSAWVVAVFADKYKWRMPFIVGPQLCVVVSFAVLFAKAAAIQSNIGLCYFAVCLACAGMYPIFPGVNAWNVANSAGAAKRAIAIGYLICAGNIGGVVGSYIYQEREAPRYPTGYGNSLAFASAGIVAMLVLEFCLWSSNQRNARLTDEDVRARYTDDQLEKLGDRSPLYKYSL
ncbi:uncharacterized protein PG998_006468 [Apiospora kogelbergensis]|uniref:uncharacterized protein n=1 Tax=Apiospora kogelbergensis TaxID=1337665 RepID=UPI00312E063F